MCDLIAVALTGGNYISATKTILKYQYEGDIGGYPIPQYRKKNGKYRDMRRKSSKYRYKYTAYFNHIYNGFPVLMVASI